MKKSLTRDMYDAMLKAFRDQPGNAANAARYAGCERRMAQRAYETGWECYPWATPIRQVLHDERVAARAAVATQEQAEVAAWEASKRAAANEAAATLKEEGNLLKLGRNDATGILVCAASLVPAVRVLCTQLAEQLKDPEIDPATGKPAKLSPAEVMRVVDRFASFAKKGVEMAEALVQLERLRRGDPTEITEHRGELAPVSLDEAREKLAAANEALDRAAAQGLTVLDGGLAGVART